jgi:hypothetical protein
MYRRKKIPPVRIASTAQITRTIAGSTSRYSATPPATPPRTDSVCERYRRRFMNSLLQG